MITLLLHTFLGLICFDTRNSFRVIERLLAWGGSIPAQESN